MHCFREERLNYAVRGQLGRITDISSFPSVDHTKAMLPLSDPAPREYNFEPHFAPLVRAFSQVISSNLRANLRAVRSPLKE
jgi:hypothetical protein